ncbi:hypothetical protein PSACC_03132 [Paramicrosporidium saccamoebae]|uniref:Uncharacterized protein n=1 Tax=Paramicrosporidium saccamoebae TaxID=1246581 RepID=A0A2H9TH22_9FUNG|nr:hypothetical protein PSACC_03132 [Paramicrosporidium saccamoebae]
MKIDITLLLAFIAIGAVAADPDCTQPDNIVAAKLAGTDAEFAEYRSCSMTGTLIWDFATRIHKLPSGDPKFDRLGKLLAQGNCSLRPDLAMVKIGDIAKQYWEVCFTKAIGDKLRGDSADGSLTWINLHRRALAEFMRDLGRPQSVFDPQINTIETLTPHLLQYQAARGSKTPVWKPRASSFLAMAIDHKTPQMHRALLALSDAGVKQIETALDVIEDVQHKSGVGHALIAMIVMSTNNITDEFAVSRINAILHKIRANSGQSNDLKEVKRMIKHFSNQAPPFALRMLELIGNPKLSISGDLSRVSTQSMPGAPHYSSNNSIQSSLVSAALKFHTDPLASDLGAAIGGFEYLESELNGTIGTAVQDLDTYKPEGENEKEKGPEEIGEEIKELLETITNMLPAETMALFGKIFDVSIKLFEAQDKPDQQKMANLKGERSAAVKEAIPSFIDFAKDAPLEEYFSIAGKLYELNSSLLEATGHKKEVEYDAKISEFISDCNSECRGELIEPHTKQVSYFVEKAGEVYKQVYKQAKDLLGRMKSIAEQPESDHRNGQAVKTLTPGILALIDYLGSQGVEFEKKSTLNVKNCVLAKIELKKAEIARSKNGQGNEEVEAKRVEVLENCAPSEGAY